MKVECPNCQTKFNLPDDKVGPEGAKVRCGVCKHVFHVDPYSPDDFPGFGDSGAAPVWPVQGEDESLPGDFASQLEGEARKERSEDQTVSSSEFISMDLGGPTKREPGLSGKGLVLAILLGVIVVAGIFGTAAYFFKFWPFVHVEKPATSAMENAPTPPKKEPAPDYTEQIKFDSYNSYFVDNEKMGESGNPAKLFVIEGKLVNNSPATLGQITVEATLLDAKEAPVVSKTITAGPKASNFELKTMSKEDLESRLNSTQEIMLNNGRVKPGDDVPFMVVFTNIPDTVKNYSLKVASYLEVAPEPGQANPEQGQAKPQPGQAKPEQGQAKPEQGQAKPPESPAKPAEQK